jgi:hypothetical protein
MADDMETKVQQGNEAGWHDRFSSKWIVSHRAGLGHKGEQENIVRNAGAGSKHE